MNKKYITHILILLIIIENAFTQSIISKTYNVENTIDYWTEERMANAKPLLSSNKLNKTVSNDRKDSFANVPDLNNSEILTDKPLAVGKLFFTSHGESYTCTASVIDTSDGNIGITAAHCLYAEGEFSEDVIFYPGYDNGKPSRLGKIVVLKISVPNNYINFEDDDYGAILFKYQGKLKDHTGSFGWGLNPPDQVKIVAWGYPAIGDMNCGEGTTDGKTCCIWRGDATLEHPPARRVPAYFGKGSSGGPWIMKETLPHYLGYLIGVTAYHIDEHSEYSDVLNFALVRQLIKFE
ncbi:16732_t:CDS:1 [Dentiscutata erythropus]|uniref:16732_t:CDS:1 n=1 Tax=Dentiscutata erythropus TaxID=1348616 RepID=A0A9N9BF44_9GLOM|nr:16732_t:CDS:1 [Dentiscutata erythropus]